MSNKVDEHLSKFNNLIGVPKGMNTLQDYKSMRKMLAAWRKREMDAIWETYKNADSVLLDAALEAGVYEMRDDGVCVPVLDDNEVDEEELEPRFVLNPIGAKYWAGRLKDE